MLRTGLALKTASSARTVEHSIFPIYVVLAYVLWNWWLKSKMGYWLYFFMDYNRPSCPCLERHASMNGNACVRPSSIPIFLTLAAINIASFKGGAKLVSFLE